MKSDTLALMRTNQLADGVGVNFPFWEMPGTVFGLGFALRSTLVEGESDLRLGEYHWGEWLEPIASCRRMVGSLGLLHAENAGFLASL